MGIELADADGHGVDTVLHLLAQRGQISASCARVSSPLEPSRMPSAERGRQQRQTQHAASASVTG